ncbi:signal recognition particle-docking protein FtsY [Candidatus Rickettsiella isopodorum]|jgi:fused signal recognition particle receptor|uniref:signal recognition particle-docking protein FtsY n=1 Tax=Candidatus Rickettsiella isopodorum TaxID=1225476 RepID=UPI000A02CC22|nr:signal recognition particle-docking protein FtsY [Candidatus Rickettsiella isopodorum]
MFKFLKRKESQPDFSDEERVISSKPRFFNRIKNSLQKTRHQLTESLARLVLGKKKVDAELIEEVEELLLTADVGPTVTEEIIQCLSTKLARNQLADGLAVWEILKQQLGELLQPCESALVINSEHKPTVILVVGVNGVGKTTSIGKLAHYLQKQGKQVMLAAGDTFRAAATEQLTIWAERNHIPIVAQHQGADSASVIYDAFQAAKVRNIDVLIADTAGRLHSKNNLMQELQKVKKVISKLDATAPHEIMLILDAGTGQNALLQAEAFNKAIALTSLMLTKLDGTAKGGVIFAIAKKLALPIRFVGLGEGIEDLQVFSAQEFVRALFSIENNEVLH